MSFQGRGTYGLLISRLFFFKHQKSSAIITQRRKKGRTVGMRFGVSTERISNEILKIIIEMFLPHMNYLTLEQTFFSQALPKTVKLFDDMMCELTSQARELSSQNLEIQTTLRNILQTMVQLVGALTGCVQHVCATQESIILENIHSLPSSVLHIIKSTLVHCKNSESVYSGRLHLVSDLLQALFKEAYSLQKQLMELLDMVCMDPLVDDSDDILNMVMSK
ncbi:uncharacterized protein C1orf112 homolog isoform X1 [Otolemur garnettii]|uniref:uncharacterized protein C1orf112 homolog isoform X1 n=1 Tax=Otolemur garnettii TaxID=30611 RepID=UPI000C7F55E2|nr:uncharacterized protein C1orf112 homolog isoform X1 [Otolemur garnettii]